jgi:hypothetical protein
MERCHHWPTVAAAARAHRRSKTSTRPGYRAPLSRAFRGPHALPRLLQTFCFHEHDHGPLEHPRPPNPWLGRLPARAKVAFQSRATAGGTQGQGSRITESRHSPSRLLTTETSPQPRSLRAPPVASTALRPVRKDVGDRMVSPTPRLLAPQPRRKGRATPDFREEVRRSPTRGAFRRRAVPKDGGGASRGANRSKHLPAPFSPTMIRARDARSDMGGSAFR